MTDQLLGPLAALALALLFLTLFYTARILSSKTVLKEDYDKMVEITKTQADGLQVVSVALTELVEAVRDAQKTGGL